MGGSVRRSSIAFLMVIILLNVSRLVISVRNNPDSIDVCSEPRVDPRILQPDQMTVVINGYSEQRIPLLHSIAAAYSASQSVAEVLVLWCNPTTPSQILSELSRNLTVQSTVNAPISVSRETTRSLNSRFHPRKSIKTRGVLICDDDVELDRKSIDFAFRVWKSNHNRLVGFFARSHGYDLPEKTWIYTVHHDKYSIVLTKAVIMHVELLYQYTCSGGEAMKKMRKHVEEARNCEDILMNFVAAEKVNVGPILVGAKKVRDWGDPRNEGGIEEERTVGLSSRRREHRKRRGECIKEFHRILGRMPLRYSYGKVVNSVGEQGLCEKGGKLMFCDEQVF